MVNRRRILGVGTFLLLTAFVSSTPAFQSDPPPVTYETIKGRWEGISLGEPRVFVLKISGPKNTIIHRANGGEGYPLKSRSLIVTKGTFVLEAVDEIGERFTFRGSGNALPEFGRMEGTVTWYSDDGKPYSIRTHFFKQSGGYIARLRALLDDAESTEPRPQK